MPLFGDIYVRITCAYIHVYTYILYISISVIRAGIMYFIHFIHLCIAYNRIALGNMFGFSELAFPHLYLCRVVLKVTHNFI